MVILLLLRGTFRIRDQASSTIPKPRFLKLPIRNVCVKFFYLNSGSCMATFLKLGFVMQTNNKFQNLIRRLLMLTKWLWLGSVFHF